MTMIRFNTHVGADGSILIPTTPFAVGEEVEVVLRVPKENGEQTEQRQKAVRQRFYEIWKELPTVEITDEEIEKLKHERRMRKML
jgi:F420-0:gamma-glutamyl ligase-like protein